MLRRNTKSGSKPFFHPASQRVTTHLPLPLLILTYVELSTWINLIHVNSVWNALLDKRCREMRNLNMLPFLNRLESFGTERNKFSQTLKQIFNALHSSPATFQVSLLRTAVYYLQQPDLLPDNKLLFPSNHVKLYETEIFQDEKPELASIRQLNTDEEKQETVVFNKLIHEIVALYKSFYLIAIDDQEQMNKVFVAKIKEKYLQVKYDFRDKNSKSEIDLVKAINNSINVTAEETQANMLKTKSRQATGNNIIYTLLAFNALLGCYRACNSSGDKFDVFMQTAVITSILALMLALIDNCCGYKNEQNEKFTLFSQSSSQRANELKALCIAQGCDPSQLSLLAP